MASGAEVWHGVQAPPTVRRSAAPFPPARGRRLARVSFSPVAKTHPFRVLCSRERKRKGCWEGCAGCRPGKMAALEEEFTLSTGVLGAGPEGFLGVEQTDKADQFLVTDSGRTVVLYKVRAARAAGCRSPLSEAEGGGLEFLLAWQGKPGAGLTEPRGLAVGRRRSLGSCLL